MPLTVLIKTHVCIALEITYAELTCIKLCYVLNVIGGTRKSHRLKRSVKCYSISNLTDKMLLIKYVFQFNILMTKFFLASFFFNENEI